MTPLFTQDDAWLGGFYELTMELHTASERDVQNALECLWRYPALEGCFVRADIEPSQQQKIARPTLHHEGHWYGVARLPNQRLSCCGSFWDDFQDRGCWLTYYLPLGSLGQAYPLGAFPFKGNETPSPESWLREINTWLHELALNVYSQAGFQSAFIGYEVDFFELKNKLQQGISGKRWDGILLPSNYGLSWYPPTIYEPPYGHFRPVR